MLSLMKNICLLTSILSICLFFNFQSILSQKTVNSDSDVTIENSEHNRINKDLKEPLSKTDDEVVEREEEAIKLDGLNVAQLKEMREKSEKFRFQAEVDRMMKLIINSLYTNKEIFLRELISNASDALDKIRFISLTDPSVLNDTEDLSIKIKADKVNNLLKIIDTGIGMTRDELIKHLGTIANSGTTEFLSNIEKEKSENVGDFIGQFGVGFYSVYLVAESVTVISKSNSDDQYIWESDSSNQFTVTKDPRGNTLKRGTEVVLRLKPSAKEYLESENLKRLIRQYSQYLSFPIYLWASKTINEVEDSTIAEDKKDKELKSDNEASSPKENIPRIKWDWERINQKKPIWTRKASQISEEEYSDFYKNLAKTKEEPLTKIHFSAEGEVSFNALLYVPSKSPPNLFEREIKESSIRLYVRRVFITDKIQDIIPRYLSFIIGIVDSDDLPLNVSRETLQQEKLMKVIQKKLVRKALDMIKKMKREIFITFWKEFRSAMKMGMIDDETNRNRLTKLVHSQSSKSDGNLTNFIEYVSRMKSEQEEIFYITTESIKHAKSSLFVEKYVKHDFEVMYFIDSLDEHALHLIEKYEGIPLLNLARGGKSFDKTEGGKSRLNSKKTDFKMLLDFLKNDVEIIKSHIENVVLTDCLLSDPFSVVPQEQGWTGNMERLARSQSGKREEDTMVIQHLKFKKNLEVNHNHPIVIKFNKMIKEVSDPKSDKNLEKLANVFFETAMIKCGYTMNNSISYSSIVEELVIDNMKRNNLHLWDKVQIIDKETVTSNNDEDSKNLDESLSHAVPQDASDFAIEDVTDRDSSFTDKHKELESNNEDKLPFNTEFAEHNEL